MLARSTDLPVNTDKQPTVTTTPVQLPPKLKPLFLGIEMLIKNSDIKPENYPEEIKNLSLNDVITKHRLNEHTYSLAGWAHVSGKQDVLDWLYQRARNGCSPDDYFLHWAIVCRQQDAVMLKLLEYEQLYKKTYHHKSPLHLAVMENTGQMARMIIDKTHDADVVTEGNNTPLHLAVAEGNASMAALLLENKAKIDIKDGDGDTALHYAVKGNRQNIIKLLIKAGANPLAQNAAGDTPQHIALQKKGVGMVLHALLEIKDNAGINIPNRGGRTPFTIVAANGGEELVRRWLPNQGGANNDNNPETATQESINNGFKAATRQGKTGVVELLLPYIDNIKSECLDKSGSALMIAAFRQYADIVKLLCMYRVNLFINEKQKDAEK